MKKLVLGAAAAVSLACWPVTSCIARGAWVQTPRGKRRIEELQPGDEIYSADPESGALVATKITATKSAKRECVALQFAEGGLIVTSDHPLYCPETRTWAPAGDWALKKRTQLLRITEERVESIAVREVSTFSGVHEVFDLTVEHELHNFVANGILVHNKSPPPVTCTDADGGSYFEFEQCTCANGTVGTVECFGETASCFGCDSPDGGAEADGGTGDAGP